MRSAARSGGVWHDPAFRWFWAANTVTTAGKATTAVVLPLLLFQLTDSASRTALVLVVQAVPYLTLGLVAAALVDRVNRRLVMVASNLVSAVALGSVPVAAAFGVLSLGHVYLAALASAVVFVCFDAAYFGAVPAIVGRGQLVAASSVTESTYQVVNVVAPAAAGALAVVFGPAAVLWVETGALLVAAVVLARVRRPFGTAPAAGSGGAGASGGCGGAGLVRRLVGDVAEGLRYVRRHPLIWPLTVSGFGTSFTGGAVMGLLVVYGVRRLGLAGDAARIGWLYSAGGVGALLTAVALPALARRLGAPRVTLLGVVANLAFLLCLAAATALPVALVVMALWQGTYTLLIVNGVALRQRLTPDRLQGRVNVTARMIAWGGQPFGAAVGGVLADRLSIQLTYAVMALGVATSTAVVWASPLRRADARAVSLLAREADRPHPA